MIFGIVIILLIAAIAYFHYVQGLFSSTISAICAMLAAVISISYHETVIAMLLKGAAANYAQGMVLCALFALVYTILRVIADKAMPGNVRYPLLVDKIGSAAMGVIAGIFATGVLAMAAQSLPFGPSVAGYARWAVSDHEATIVGARGMQQDARVFDAMKESTMDPEKSKSLILPVDDMVVGLVGHLSEAALTNQRPLAAVHPDWIGELFGQRAGVQVGAKRVLLNLPGLNMVELKGLFKAPDNIKQIDAEHKDIRENSKLLDPVSLSAAEAFLVARIYFDPNASDEDNKVRVSCAAVRLVGWHEQGDERTYFNYYPIGTLEGASTLFLNKPDDPLVLNGGKSADFVFVVNREDVFEDPSPKPKELKIKNDVFIEVKRMAHLDLSGNDVKPAPEFGKDVEVIRKNIEQAKNLPRRTASGQTVAAVETVAGPLDIRSVELSNKLFHPLNPGVYNGDPADVTIGSSGSGVITQQKFSKLTMDSTQTLNLIGGGDNATVELLEPDGRKMVQVVAKPPATGDHTRWAESISLFELVDANGARFKANGAVARVKISGGPDRMVARYEADREVGSVDLGEGNVVDVWLLFNVPSGTQITQVQYEGKPISDRGVTVP